MSGRFQEERYADKSYEQNQAATRTMNTVCGDSDLCRKKTGNDILKKKT
jgi:hypothetical protein